MSELSSPDHSGRRRRKLGLFGLLLLFAAGLGHIFESSSEEIPFVGALSAFSHRVGESLGRIAPFALYRHYRAELHPEFAPPPDLGTALPLQPSPYCRPSSIGMTPRCQCVGSGETATTVCSPELGKGPFDVGAPPVVQPDCCFVPSLGGGEQAAPQSPPSLLPEHPEISAFWQQLQALKNAAFFAWRQDTLTRILLIVSYGLVLIGALALAVRNSPGILVLAALASPFLASLVALVLLYFLIALNFIMGAAFGFLAWAGGTIIAAYKLYETATNLGEISEMSVDGTVKARNWLRRRLMRQSPPH